MPTLNRTHQGIVNPLEYGATLTSATLTTALGAIGSSRAYLMLTAVDRAGTPGAWSLTSSVVIPSNVTLLVAAGAQLNIANDVTITCAAGVETGLWQWISLTGTGKIVFSRTTVSPEWWGAVRNGSTSDLTPVRQAFAASKDVLFTEGTYWLGSHTGTTTLVDLTGRGDGIRIRTRGKVTLTATTTGSGSLTYLFLLNVNNNFHCEPIAFTETNLDIATLRGAIGFYLSNWSNQSNWGNCTFESIDCTNMIAGVVCSAYPTSATLRIRGIHIGHLNATNGYYGLNCQNDGDGVVVDNLTASFCVRPYFVYGVQGHTVSRLANRNPNGSSAQCLIKRETGSLDTKGIKVNYTCSDSGASQIGLPHIAIEHGDLSGGTIAEVDLNVSISGSVGAYYPVYLRNFNAGTPSSASSTNVTREIRLSGSCDTFADPCQNLATYVSKGQMTFVTGQNFVPSQDIYNNFTLNQQTTAVTWEASSVDPSLGNGTFTRRIDVVNGLAFVWVHLVMGSTTTYGTGYWWFQTPFTAKAAAVGTLHVLDTGTNFRTGACLIPTGGSAIFLYIDSSGGPIDATTPFTWQTGDELNLTLTFPLSG